jgi:hypothetical protein
MIATQRAYELNSKAIQTSDQMLQRWGSCDETCPRPVPVRRPAAGRLPGDDGRQDYMYPRVQMADTGAGRPQPPVVPVPQPNGAIFNPASYRPLFEDHRARLVGDTLTVQIVEKVAASQKSTSGDKTAAAASMPASPPSRVSRAPRSARAAAGGNSSNTFAGKGAPRVPTTSPAPSPWSCARCCPTATCWWPARSRSASTPTSTCCASPARSTRAASSRATAVSSTQIANVRSSSAAAARRPTPRRSAGWPASSSAILPI